MTQAEIKSFVDCMTYEDCNLKWKDKTYWCLGVTHAPVTGTCAIGVWECDPDTLEFKEELFSFTGRTTEECMMHFLEDTYWDGKAFCDVATEMEWIDL